MGKNLLFVRLKKINAYTHVQITHTHKKKLTLRKESKAPLDMLSTMIIMVLPGERQREQDSGVHE